MSGMRLGAGPGAGPGVSWLVQGLLAFALIWLGWSFYGNAQANLARLGSVSGFGFLDQPAGFSVSMSLIGQTDGLSYGQVFIIGLLNTLLVAVCAVVLATLLGFTMGVARLSGNVVIRALASAYVEVTRNLPPLFQILFWYLAVLATLPGPRQSWSFGLATVLNTVSRGCEAFGLETFAARLAMWAGESGTPGIFLNNRGLIVPRPLPGEGAGAILLALFLAIALGLLLWFRSRQRRERTGQGFLVWPLILALIIGLPWLVAGLTGFSIELEKPVLRGFNFSGGLTLMPEFMALLLALSIYTAGYIAEIVRAGILSVPKGQVEAARALGLSGGKILRKVVLPQAMRVIVPPLTSQYVNIAKNSTLGVAIGYPDLLGLFGGTVLERTGLAIEIISMIMAVYLAISLFTALLMNLYARRIALVER
ncbi:amino acid ABC transporter permease [Xanthobacter sp. TB0139]|uniref:amino acid ABC transporter permease n=1 Tax=Xanthobacter sp. TB0139 TaxID=3459178 RepID=UPI0040396C26